MTRFVLLSDAHLVDVETPSGDVLVAAGDMTAGGTLEELELINAWFARQPQARKFFVPGNHEFPARYNPKSRAVLSQAKWLVDESCNVDGVTLYGTCTDNVPENVDMLITHFPPYGVGDAWYVNPNVHLGCPDLMRRLLALRNRPKVHVFGHVHEGERVTRRYDMLFLNVSLEDKPVTVLDYDRGSWELKLSDRLMLP